MNRINRLLFSLLAILIFNNAYSQRQSISLNSNWHFTLHDDAQFSATDVEVDDWQEVVIPHDWSHEKGVSRDGAQRDNGGYFDGGIGWYRTTFMAPESWKSKQVQIEFDGVYMNSEVWINGHYLGKRPYGYISFRYELSEFLKSGENSIAVRVDNSKEPSARWYHPCGIYAPVKLIVTGNQRISPNGIYITTPVVTSENATLKIQTNLFNSAAKKVNAVLETSLCDAAGEIVKVISIPLKWKGNSELSASQEIVLDKPNLWNPESPYLYKVTSRLLVNKKLIDEVETNYGIRELEWKTDSGFFLNGKVCKLLGVCEHYEGGPVGGAWTKPLLRWKLSLLKDMGVNAIRAAHNPAPTMFYDLCDEMGLLVMDEIFDGWKRKAPMDYGAQAFNEWWERDITEWLERNRNHPSIIIYSLGNETGGVVGKEMVAKCHKLDPTRLVTSGHSGSEFMDVFGVNGSSEKQGFYSDPRPDKPFVATEAPHTWQTRGYYRTQTWYRDGYPNKNQQPFEMPNLTEKEIFHYEWAAQDKWVNGKQHFNSSYDNGTLRITSRKNWELMRDLPWYSGHFRWTGFDYYGEAGYVHGGWPFRLFMSGALDVAGFKKDLFFFYQSQWTEKPMVHILPHWTHPTMEVGTEVPVWVYSNCDEVELFLNGRSLGKDKPGTKWDEMQCEWMVPYEIGTLLAVGYVNGKEFVRSTQTTAGVPSTIQLNLEQVETDSDKELPKVVTVSITDSQGTMYPYGENQIYYYLDGKARLLALENGDPVDTTKNVGVNHKKAFMGLTRAFYQVESVDTPCSLTVGAIVGEKQLLTSQDVSIDVKTISLNGNSDSNVFEIFYTLNSSVPTEESKLYSGAFPVVPGTIVKAIVVRKGEVILRMEEKFDNDQGLFWGNEESSLNSLQTSGMLAVDGEHSGAEVKGLNGKSYLDFSNKKGSVRWYQENDGSAGAYNLTLLYYTAAVQSNCEMELWINNHKVEVLKFTTQPKSESDLSGVTTGQTLQAGANYIELRTTDNCGPNIFMLKVE
jgi:beta-galactosidase